MARTMTPAQYRSYVQQENNRRRQAVDRYNQAARNHNRKVQAAVDQHNRNTKTAVDKYTREVHVYNERVRMHRQRVQQAIRQLQSRPTVITHHAAFRTSVETLHHSYVALDASPNSPAANELLDLSERENANSLDVMNALMSPPAVAATADDLARLKDTRVGEELLALSPDLDRRWRGALFALDPRNPDASRHFCTSAREIFTTILEQRAPDVAVLEAIPGCHKTPEGRPTRRTRIQFALQQRGLLTAPLEQFVDDDIDNIIELFKVFNSGTHGEAASIEFSSLVAIKTRVEDGIAYLSQVFG